MTQSAKRGFMPKDTRDFSEKALPTLRKAAEEVSLTEMAVCFFMLTLKNTISFGGQNR